MKLSAAITATLLSGTSTSTASNSSGIASSATSLNALEQFLQSKEDNVGRRNRRNRRDLKVNRGGTTTKSLYDGGGPDSARAGPGLGDPTNSARGGTGGRPVRVRSLTGRNPSHDPSDHTGAMDVINGITTVDEDYFYGEPVNVNFELTNEFADVEVRQLLNVGNREAWSMGLYQRMQHPTCGDVGTNFILKVSLDQIDDLRPNEAIPLDPTGSNIPLDPTGSNIPLDPTGGSNIPLDPTGGSNIPLNPNETNGRRVLQDQEPGEGNQQPGEGEEVGMVEPIDMGPLSVPQEPIDLGLGFSGSAVFDDTSFDTLSELIYGIGFHIHLLDENDCPIMGPGGFYLQKTAGTEADDEADEAAAIVAGVGLFNHASIRQINSGGIAAQTFGGGTNVAGMMVGGGDENALPLSTTAALDANTYSITTNFEEYEDGDTVIVNLQFNLVPGADRRLQDDGAFVTTTTLAPPEEVANNEQPTMGEDDENGGFIGVGMEEEDEIDETDISLYRMGVFMYMQAPQEGVVSAFYSVPLCEDPLSCDDVTLTFSTNEFFSVENGVYGFDIVVLNGKGVGIVDPTHFYIIDETV